MLKALILSSHFYYLSDFVLTGKNTGCILVV